MQRRIIGVYCVLTVLMTTLIYRLHFIDTSDYITMAAAGQGSYNLSIATTRGVIYDRKMRELVNTSYMHVASVLPSPQAAPVVLSAVGEDERAAVAGKLAETLPFALVLQDDNVYAKGVDVFRIPKRYGEYQYAPHIVGYMGGDGEGGAAGAERAYDAELKKSGGKINCTYSVDAAGHVMTGAAMSVSRENEMPTGGVSLTLDKELQEITQEALKAGCEKGAAIVMDVQTGEILASASLPVFDQNNISASLESDDAPFINRAFCGYNIGSVFKLVVSAAALEKGIRETQEYECTGYIDVGGVVFHCNNNAVHGACDMQKALKVSCNTYFISLAQELGGEYLVSFCKNLGLGASVSLMEGVETQSGNLPSAEELKNPAALANLGFGQGSSLASPLQISAVICAIANGGTGVMPWLVRGVTDDGTEIVYTRRAFAENRLLHESTSNTMQRLMESVVADGSGRTAKPLSGGAGGKTSSAQTGQLKDGEEIVHAWFAGFYPAATPKYSIVVFVEGGESGEQVAAPIFKGIADGIAKLR